MTRSDQALSTGERSKTSILATRKRITSAFSRRWSLWIRVRAKWYSKLESGHKPLPVTDDGEKRFLGNAEEFGPGACDGYQVYVTCLEDKDSNQIMNLPFDEYLPRSVTLRVGGMCVNIEIDEGPFDIEFRGHVEPRVGSEVQ